MHKDRSSSSDASSRRTFLKQTGAVGSTVTFASLAGCSGNISGGGGQNAESFVPGERDFSGTTITWYDHESGTLPALQAAAKEWEKKTGGTVKFELFSPTGLRDKESTLFSSQSNKIDIVGYPYQWGMAFVAGGHLQNLESYVERLDDSWDQDDFIQRVWDIYGRFDDGLYALPTKFDLWIAFWNKDHFESAGLDPNKAPETWSELEEYAATLDTDGHAGFDQTWIVGQAELNFLLGLHTRGAPFYDENAYPAFWKEEHRDKAIETVKSWKRITQHSSQGFSSLSFSSSTSVFTQGKTSMVYKWHAFAPIMLDPDKSQVANSLGIGLTCGAANREQMLGGWGAGISKYSDNKEAAFDMLSFALNKQNSLEGARKHGMSSARKSVLQDDQVREAQPWTETALSALQQSFNRPKTLGWIPAKTSVGEFMQTALTSDVDIESELQKVAAEVWQVSKDNGHNPGNTGEKP